MRALIAIITLSLFLPGCAAPLVATAGGAGTAAYYGTLSPDRYLPEKCSLQSGLACMDFTAESEEVMIIIQSRLGYGIKDIVFTLTPKEGSPVACSPQGDDVMADGEQEVFICSGSFNDGKLDGALDFTYTNANTGERESKSGNIVVKV